MCQARLGHILIRPEWAGHRRLADSPDILGDADPSACGRLFRSFERSKVSTGCVGGR